MLQNYSTPASGSENPRAKEAEFFVEFAYADKTNADAYETRLKTWDQFLGLAAYHEVARHADGPVIVLADLVGGRRTKTAVKAATGVALHVNCGLPLDEITDALEGFGHRATLHTTFDHGRLETLIDKDKVTRWLIRRNVDVTDQDSLIHYSREALGWHNSILDSMEYQGDRQTPDGLQAVVRHAPFPMYRVILPLAEPFAPTAAPTQAAGIEMWGGIVRAVAEALGLPPILDKGALDPAALVPLPRRREGAEAMAFEFDGEPLNWRDLDVDVPAARAVEKAAAAPTFDLVKAVIDALPPKADMPDPEPVLAMIARLDNAMHRETLLSALKVRTGTSIQSLRQDVRNRRRSAGDGADEGVKVDKETGYRTFVHVGDPDHRQTRAFLLKTMEKANAGEPVFTLNLGQVMGLRRHDGRVSFQPLTARQFQSALFDHCSFAAHRDGGDLIHRIPDGDICGVVLEGVKPGELPVQPTIRRAPTMARDGRILDRDGWFGDVLVDLGGLTPPVVPSDPTQQEIDAARTLILEDVLGDFPFDDGDNNGAKGESEASRANAFGMLLTPFVRDQFDGPSPVFSIVKPSPGVGGTLLAETVQRLFDGHASATMPNTRNEEEMQKHLLAAMLGDDSFLFFDNVTDFNSETVKRSTTAERIGGRILGLSKTVSRPNLAMWIVTGINPRLGPEMARRSVFINLNSRVENNAARNYTHGDYKGWLRDNRSRIIGALLTLIRAWWKAGAKPGKAKLASFESWSGVVSGILETAGINGFLDNPREVSADREGAEVKAFIADWWKVWGEADTAEAAAFNYADVGGFVTGYGEDRRLRFGAMLDGLRGRTFDLDHNRVMFGVGEKAGWRLVHLGKLEKTDDADLA